MMREIVVSLRRQSTAVSAEEILKTLKAEDLADTAGVDIATARRWKAKGRLPEPVHRLLSVTAFGRLDVFGWTGWRIIRGELVSPEGWSYGPGDVLALTLLRTRVALLEAERRKFLALEAQPEPGEAIHAFTNLDRVRA